MTAAPADRHVTIDTIRGVAVMGILVMNIVGMGLPAYAYVDPTYFGGTAPADLFAWGAAYALADGKMRALFTVLFGASLAIVADRAEAAGESAARVHYRRIGWLFLFGMIHAWAIWYGDILVEYAIVGALLFSARHWPVRALLFGGLVLLGIGVVVDLATWFGMAQAQAAAMAPDASAAARAAWAATIDAFRPDPAEIARDIGLYRGGIGDAFAARVPMTVFMQSVILPASLPETLGFAMIGLLLYRTGFLTGGWSARAYRRLLLGALPGIALTAGLAWDTIASGFDVVRMQRNDLLSLLLRPWIMLGYASAIILWVQGAAARALADRVAAAGRMAFSNYLGTSLVCTTLFYGYGFGLYAHLTRAELYIVVAIMWLLMLGWSAAWLARYRYGPLEWLWRSLARCRIEKMRRMETNPIATHSH